MKNVIIYVGVMLCLVASKAVGQNSQTFEQRVKAISEKVESITREEKAALKVEVDQVNAQLQSGSITADQADQQKIELADARAANIERRTAAAQDELKKLVQEKVDGAVKPDTVKGYKITAGLKGIRVEDRSKRKDTMKGESRTTSQLVFAFGLNHYLTDGAMAHSDFRVWNSNFYELGLSWNTRLLQNQNLLHLKYGLSMQWNTVAPTDNRFYAEAGDQTNLVTVPFTIDDARFRNVNLVLPLHLEFDFSGKSKHGTYSYFETHKSWRAGLGGFVGANVRSKQIFEFNDTADNEVKQKTKGDFNVNTLVYGASAYIGYESVSLYCKYDLQPVFEDNLQDQNNISFGVRFDFN